MLAVALCLSVYVSVCHKSEFCRKSLTSRARFGMGASFHLSHTHTHTHPFNDPMSGTTRVSWYQKGKTNLDITNARDSEWQWHQLGHMQVCTSLQSDDHASTPPLSFLQARCPSCYPTNSVKALKALSHTVLKRNSGISRTVLNSGLRKFHFGLL